MFKEVWIPVILGILLFSAPLHWTNSAPNDPVNIPDANLRAAIETKLGKSPGDTITEAEMAGITTQLSVSTAVGDLTGLQYATGVTNMLFNHQRRTVHNGRNVTITDNTISDLSPLRNLTQLKVLNILHQDLTDISPLENLTALRELTLWRRYTSSASSVLALTSLSNKTNLYYLFLSDHVEDLSPLRGLTGLTNLILNDNRIVDLRPLGDLTALVQLHLGTNQITNISPLSRLTNLEELVLRSNVELSDISPLRHLTKLKSLWLHQLPITHSGLREVLPYLGSLKDLILQLTRISDLSVLDAFPSDVSLASLDLRYMGTIGRDVAWLLRDITPLVEFVEAGKMGHDSQFPSSPRIELEWNLALDYESIYEDLPALINDLSGGRVRYHSDDSEPALERESPKAEVYKGHPRTRHTFVVRAVNNTTISSRTYRWPYFEKVPVSFTITNPDGTVEEIGPVLTGSNGLTGVTITLGNDGDTHTVEAIVPAKTTSVSEIQHSELRVTFTAIADSTVPPPQPPRSDSLTVTFEDYPEKKPIDEFTLTIKFSEPVISFEKEDITVETELTTGTGTATLTDLTPETPIAPDGTAPDPIETYTATVELPAWSKGTVKLIVREDAAITATGEIGPSSETVSDPIAFTHRSILFLHRPSQVAMDTLIFTEFRNAEDDENDWIELKNISDEDVPLVDWEISIVESEDETRNTDRDIVEFPDYILSPGSILLIVNTDPSETDLIRGQNIENPKHNPNLHPQYLIAPEMKLPSRPYLLILRSVRDKNGKPEAFEDLLGNYHRGDVNYSTQIWPLFGTWVYTGTEARFTEGAVYQRVMSSRVISMHGVSALRPEVRGYLRGAWAVSGYHAGLGYRPGASPETSLGTPGYPAPEMDTETGTGQISISEVMFATQEMGVPSQWVELYNPSETEVVDIEGWELVIEAWDSQLVRHHTTFTFKSLEVLPNQTVLLVARNDRTSENIPQRRIYDVHSQHGEAFPVRWRGKKLLGSEGVALRLLSPDGTLIDTAGNLDGQLGRDNPRWALPSGWTETGARSSLIRIYEDRLPAQGTISEGWVRAAETDLLMGYTYWGSPSDNGTPGYRRGSPLPVVLSSFRADRGEESVIVKWTTASEMANAGFNILRSETKKGQFVKVNPTLILGAGTTSEQNAYTYTDTTAKPNVAYYYQIEEVSLSGERRAVATVRLRGHLSATGKLLYKWADVKAQD